MICNKLLSLAKTPHFHILGSGLGTSRNSAELSHQCARLFHCRSFCADHYATYVCFWMIRTKLNGVVTEYYRFSCIPLSRVLYSLCAKLLYSYAWLSVGVDERRGTSKSLPSQQTNFSISILAIRTCIQPFFPSPTYVEH